MAKLLFKNSATKPLPPFIRQRLTLQSALLSYPQKYMKNVRFDMDKSEKMIPERECPPKPLVSEKTQTRDIMDAETNTKNILSSSVESKKSKLKMKCAKLAKEARIVSRSHYMEIARLIRDGNTLGKATPTLAGAADSKPCLPGCKQRRGILKNVLEEVKIEGMCSQGTATEVKRPTLERILKENHLFLKYSKNCKPKKKRVRMETQPAFISNGPEESVQSLVTSEDERPKTVQEDNEDSVDSSPESLERKPARLALLSPSGDPDAEPERRPSVLIRNMTSDLQLNKPNALEKQRHPQRPRQLSQNDACVKRSQNTLKKPRRRVPRERLYFKNVFSSFPGTCRR